VAPPLLDQTVVEPPDERPPDELDCDERGADDRDCVERLVELPDA
jgi:hypothetical protein